VVLEALGASFRGKVPATTWRSGRFPGRPRRPVVQTGGGPVVGKFPARGPAVPTFGSGPDRFWGPFLAPCVPTPFKPPPAGCAGQTNFRGDRPVGHSMDPGRGGFGPWPPPQKQKRGPVGHQIGGRSDRAVGPSQPVGRGVRITLGQVRWASVPGPGRAVGGRSSTS
jgi:hypothetical protein